MHLKKELLVVLVSGLPVIELRGGIPLGMKFGFSPLKSLVLSVLGNILIIPLILFLGLPLMESLREGRVFKASLNYIRSRTLKKTQARLKKNRALGLFLLVALPIPTTGVWTGALAASLFKVDQKKAFYSLASGVVISGLIVVFLIKNLNL